MRAAIAIVLAVGLAGCIKPLDAATAEQAWQRCSGAGAADYRISQCSAVIGFAGATPQRRAEALLMRGSIRSTEGEYPRALADFGRALRIDANNAQAYLERGIVHQARGAFDFAVRDFDQALLLQPGFQSALERRAQVQEQRVTAFRAQIDALDVQIRAAPKDASLLNERCWLRAINNDDLNAALADCDASLSVAPNDAGVLDSRGLVHFKRGEYAAALADYEAAVRLEPQRGHYLYGRGLARLGLGMNAEGNADLARAEELEPGIALAYVTYNVVMPNAASQLEAAED